MADKDKQPELTPWQQEHDYETDKPSFQEIKPGHFVWANTAEAENYKAQA